MQTKLQSFIESLTNIAIGLVIAVISNLIVLPLFGYDVNTTDSIAIAIVFTIISLVRSYTIRRFFNKR